MSGNPSSPVFPLQKNCQAPSPCAKLQPTQTKPLPPREIFQRIADELWSNTYNLNRTQNQSFPKGTRMHESVYPLCRHTKTNGRLCQSPARPPDSSNQHGFCTRSGSNPFIWAILGQKARGGGGGVLRIVSRRVAVVLFSPPGSHHANASTNTADHPRLRSAVDSVRRSAAAPLEPISRSPPGKSDRRWSHGRFRNVVCSYLDSVPQRRRSPAPPHLRRR